MSTYWIASLDESAEQLHGLLGVREDGRAAARHRHARRLRRRREALVDGAPLDRLQRPQAVAKLGHFCLHWLDSSVLLGPPGHTFHLLVTHIVRWSHLGRLDHFEVSFSLERVTPGWRAWPARSVCWSRWPWGPSRWGLWWAGASSSTPSRSEVKEAGLFSIFTYRVSHPIVREVSWGFRRDKQWSK